MKASPRYPDVERKVGIRPSDALLILGVLKGKAKLAADRIAYDAIQLGEEAIARINYQRQKPTVPHKTLLPSELKEGE